DPAMAAQHFEWCPTGHLPDGHHGIGACTGQLGAVRTPVQVEEGGGVALQDPHALATGHLPQLQGAIFTATEQVAAVGGEGQAVYLGAMALQHHLRVALLALPHPDRVVKAATWPACLHPHPRPLLAPARYAPQSSAD